MSLDIVVMMRVSLKMAELLLVIPTQKRYVAEKLVGIVYVSSVEIYACLKPNLSSERRPDFEEELIGRELFGLHHSHFLAHRVRLKDGHQSTEESG